MFVGLHVLASFLPSADFIKCFRAKHGSPKMGSFSKGDPPSMGDFFGFPYQSGTKPSETKRHILPPFRTRQALWRRLRGGAGVRLANFDRGTLPKRLVRMNSH